MNDQAAIERFIAERGVTRCPDAGTRSATEQDRREIEAYHQGRNAISYGVRAVHARAKAACEKRKAKAPEALPPSPPVNRFKNIAGQTFTRLTAIKRGPDDLRGKSRWHCRCQCGKETLTRTTELTGGGTRSCGCLARENCPRIKHGMFGTRIYGIWREMVSRCNNPRHKGYPLNGAKGIRVCQRWREFANFHADMGARPSEEHKLTRLDRSRNFEPENCAWVAHK